MMINENELINKSMAIKQLSLDLKECGVERARIEYSLNKLTSLRIESIERNQYLRGWHDAINEALKESVYIHSFDGTFKVIQAETLNGLGLSKNTKEEIINGIQATKYVRRTDR